MLSVLLLILLVFNVSTFGFMHSTILLYTIFFVTLLIYYLIEVTTHKNELDLDDMNLGDRMKYYEKLTQENPTNILPYKPFIVRMDGKNFSKLSKLFLNKPFDKIFCKSMIQTASAYLSFDLRPVTAYTHSDEITLIFAPVCTYEEYKSDPKKYCHPFDGKHYKLLSELPSYASIKFVSNMRKNILDSNDYYTTEQKQKLMDLFENPKTIFDARIIVFPDDKDYEIVNHMIWRSRFDCFRNCVSMYAYHYFSSNVLKNKSTSERIEMLKSKNVDFQNDIPMYEKFGTFIKNDENKVPILKSFYLEFNNDTIDMLFSKTWNK